MLKQLTNSLVWVHDQDEALAFYTEKLGLELREDATLPEMGDFRWLTVGVVGQPDVSIVLMTPPGPSRLRRRDAAAASCARCQGCGVESVLRHG